MKKFIFFACSAVVVSASSVAQVSVDVSGYGVSVHSSTGSDVSVNTGRIESDVQMEGVAIINEKVFIDGNEVPRGKSTYVSKKTKKTYLINWGKNGNVSVSEK